MSSKNPNRRVTNDVKQLIENGFDVTVDDTNCRNLVAKLHGPDDTLYKGGVWDVRIHLPEGYPFKSPSIGFATKIFHPNVDLISGTICLNVLNQCWTPLYDLVHIMGTFLPQLLRNPNPRDPMNHFAAKEMETNPVQYDTLVLRYVKKYATLGNEDKVEEEKGKGDSDLSDSTNDN